MILLGLSEMVRVLQRNVVGTANAWKLVPLAVSNEQSSMSCHLWDQMFGHTIFLTWVYCLRFSVIYCLSKICCLRTGTYASTVGCLLDAFH
jgi:hypothetical protein